MQTAMNSPAPTSNETSQNGSSSNTAISAPTANALNTTGNNPAINKCLQKQMHKHDKNVALVPTIKSHGKYGEKRFAIKQPIVRP